MQRHNSPKVGSFCLHSYACSGNQLFTTWASRGNNEVPSGGRTYLMLSEAMMAKLCSLPLAFRSSMGSAGNSRTVRSRSLYSDFAFGSAPWLSRRIGSQCTCLCISHRPADTPAVAQRFLAIVLMFDLSKLHRGRSWNKPIFGIFGANIGTKNVG